MRIYSLFVYVFLYTPIGIIALFSFSAGRSASQFEGFSLGINKANLEAAEALFKRISTHINGHPS